MLGLNGGCSTDVDDFSFLFIIFRIIIGYFENIEFNFWSTSVGYPAVRSSNVLAKVRLPWSVRHCLTGNCCSFPQECHTALRVDSTYPSGSPPPLELEWHSCLFWFVSYRHACFPTSEPIPQSAWKSSRTSLAAADPSFVALTPLKVDRFHTQLLRALCGKFSELSFTPLLTFILFTNFILSTVLVLSKFDKL